MTHEAPPTKHSLRSEMKRRLGQLAPSEGEAAAERIAEHTLEVPEVAGARHILTCLSFGGEPDTWGLVASLLAREKWVYVPRAEPGGGPLHVHPYPCELETLSFGLRQPVRDAPELEADAIDRTLDVVLILGLAFDRRGYRLGRGAGHFDRFLVGRRAPAIGLAFDLQLLDELPSEAHDVPMAVVVTERGVWRP